jgi:hypothetical protein
MANQTLANLRAEVQERCNQENKTLVSTSEFNRYINLAIAELYDLIVSNQPHYYVSQAPFTLTASNAFDLTTVSSGFYKLRGIDYLPSGAAYPVTVMPLNFQERNRFWNQNFAGTYTLWFTPAPPVLVNDSDTLDTILNVWAEFITVSAAIPAAVKEEANNIPELGAMKDMISKRVMGASPNRDAGPQQAADYMSDRRAGDSGRRYLLEGTNLLILGGSYLDPWAL